MIALALLLSLGTPMSPASPEARRAKAELARRGIPFTAWRFVAACGAEPELVPLFLKAGASPMSEKLEETSHGTRTITALGVAVRGNQPAVISSLAASGVDLEAPVVRAANPLALIGLPKRALWLASQLGHAEAARALAVAGADLEARDVRGRTALLIAIERNHPAVVDALLAAGAELSAVGVRTTVAEAAYHGHQPIVERLLVAGASIEERDAFGCTALHWAARGEAKPALLAALVDRGVDVDAANDRRRTPLHYAASAEQDRSSAILALIDSGADLEARGSQEETPLALASRHGHVANLRALLSAGADPQVRDRRGLTPLRWAEQRADSAAADLRAAGAEHTLGDSLTMWWDRRQREEIYILLLAPLPFTLLAVGLLLLRRL